MRILDSSLLRGRGILLRFNLGFVTSNPSSDTYTGVQSGKELY